MINFKDYIRDIPNFPKEGIVFKDITPLLQNYKERLKMLNALYESCHSLNIDAVIGIEARGFMFGMPLADKLNAKFIPLRKKGKLPYDTISETYGLEYGTDVLEIHVDAISKGERVLIHDDVLATGGTAKAACNLVEKQGGKVMQCNFLMELTSLDGGKLLNAPISSVLKY